MKFPHPLRRADGRCVACTIERAVYVWLTCYSMSRSGEPAVSSVQAAWLPAQFPLLLCEANRIKTVNICRMRVWSRWYWNRHYQVKRTQRESVSVTQRLSLHILGTNVYDKSGGSWLELHLNVFSLSYYPYCFRCYKECVLCNEWCLLRIGITVTIVLTINDLTYKYHFTP